MTTDGKYGIGSLVVGTPDNVDWTLSATPSGDSVVDGWHSHPYQSQGYDHTENLKNDWMNGGNYDVPITLYTSDRGNIYGQNYNGAGVIGQPFTLCTACVPSPWRP
jgi:hypothetical protein